MREYNGTRDYEPIYTLGDRRRREIEMSTPAGRKAAQERHDMTMSQLEYFVKSGNTVTQKSLDELKAWRADKDRRDAEAAEAAKNTEKEE